MSIINKMHQDFKSVQQEQPILSNMPEKKRQQKKILQLLVMLLLGCSIGLSYLIFTEDQVSKATPAKNSSSAAEQLPGSVVSIKPAVELVTVNKHVAPAADKIPAVKVQKKQVLAVAEPEVSAKEPLPVKKHKSVNLVAAKIAAQTPLASVTKKAALAPAASSSSALASDATDKNKHLEIKTAQLTNAQLAQIHLQEADKAQAQGDLQSAAQSRLKALSLAPKLHEVRKSVALYYYAQGDIVKAQGLLQKGALVSPEYADFNLMLSRIALKAGDLQKAYLYLEKHPPLVAGNLDYYASHAALAQKFKKYAQAESLYISLLSQRPDNGRWRMSLAIAQDKQAKTAVALKNYKNALLQTDLSANAKGYIKQRLTYLAQN